MNQQDAQFNSSVLDLNSENVELESLSAGERVDWALTNLPGVHMMSSSFGAQAAVMLHMLTERAPDMPIVLIDTGYLFPETYKFIDELHERLNLNLKSYSSEYSSAWQETRYGKLWEQGIEGIEQFNKMNKTEPMKNALQDLGAGTWFSGVRRQQSSTRADIPVVAIKDDVYKVSPIIDWTDRDIYRYLTEHGLPYHPLWHEGYISIGDIHTTTPFKAGMAVEDTRFFGLKRECGLHE